MRARRDARGSIELRGPTWWLRRRELVTDVATGAITYRMTRTRLGPKSELRTHAAARAAADEWIERARPEPISPGPQVRALAYLVQFEKIQIPLMRPTSQAVYRSVIRKHIVPAVTGLKLVDIDTAWLRRFMAARAGTMERKTLANIRTVLLQVLRQAARDKYGACRIDTHEARLPRACRPAKPQRYFTGAELERIVAASEFPWRALWAVMGYAALRAGEALALTWECIDFRRRLLTVRQNAVRGTLGLPKTKTSLADVPMLLPLQSTLAAYRAELGGPTQGLLFASRTGQPLRADDVRRHRLRGLLKRLGLPPAGLHAFRHSVPRLLAERDVSMHTIRQIMRHGSTSHTETYLHRHTEDLWLGLEKAGFAQAPDEAPQSSAGVLQACPSGPPHSHPIGAQ